MAAAAISAMLSDTALLLLCVARPQGVLIAGPPVAISTPSFVADSAGYICMSCASDPRGVAFDVGTRITTSPGVMVSGTVYQLRLILGGGVLRYRLRTAAGVVGEGTKSGVAALGSMAGLLRFGRAYFAGTQSADFAAIVSARFEPSAAQLAELDRWTFKRWGV